MVPEFARGLDVQGRQKFTECTRKIQNWRFLVRLLSASSEFTQFTGKQHEVCSKMIRATEIRTLL